MATCAYVSLSKGVKCRSERSCGRASETLRARTACWARVAFQGHGAPQVVKNLPVPHGSSVVGLAEARRIVEISSDPLLRRVAPRTLRMELLVARRHPAVTSELCACERAREGRRWCVALRVCRLASTKNHGSLPRRGHTNVNQATTKCLPPRSTGVTSWSLRAFKTLRVPRDGIEPPTRGFSIPCSTN